MWNAKLDEPQAGIKIARRNITNLRYADDTSLMAEREEERKSFLMRVKEEGEKTGLKLNIQKMKVMPFGSITSWQTEAENREAVTDFLFLDSNIAADSDAAVKLKDVCFLEEKLWLT